MLYSKTTGGFYDAAIHGNDIPADAVKITDEEHAVLLAGQSEGKRISADADGKPVLTDPPKATIAEIWSAIKTERDRRSEAGCQVNGHWFHNDIKSRSQWERMANRSIALEANDPYYVDGEQVRWKTMSGSFVALTAGLIRLVVDAFEAQEVATFKAAEIHRAAMLVAADPSAYDYSGDWPAIFEPPQP